MNRKLVPLAFWIALTAVVFTTTSFTSSHKKARNIILMIGDGMGLSQVSSAYFYGNEEPNFSRFPIVGLSLTSSASNKITDSAAGATAFSTGEKTYNGAIGVSMNKDTLETLIEYFNSRAWSNGLVVTSSVTHATPAAFYAHQESRDAEYAIAAQLANNGIVDFFAGGGLKFFHQGEPDDLLVKMRKSGYLINTRGLDDTLPTHQSRFGYLLAANGMKGEYEGRGDYLEKASRLAIDALNQNKKGFFLMIEGSQIDWGGHDNDADYLISELLDFDKAIGAVLDFAEKDGNTLVIVTADHETGGFTLSENSASKEHDNELLPTFSTGGHSATLVPVFAFGPGAELFSGIYQNTEVHKKILEAINGE